MADPKYSKIGVLQGISKEKIPFFHERAYLISSNSTCSSKIEKFLKTYQISAAILYPIELNGRVLMYVCFYEFEKERVWDEDDITFINDVRRIIKSILAKRIAKNSLASS